MINHILKRVQMEKINDLATGSIPANVSTATLQQTARNYNSFGWNVLPQDYKMPLIKWEPWQETPQTEEFVKEMPWKSANAISIMTGVGYIRCLELDHVKVDYLIPGVLLNLGLPMDYKFVEKSGSGHGYHIWFYCDEYLEINSCRHDAEENQRELFEFVELKWKHCTCTITPSLHELGGKYAWLRGEPTCDDLLIVKLDSVLSVYKRLAAPTCEGKPAPYPDEILQKPAKEESAGEIDPKWEEAYSQFPLVKYLHEKCGGDLEATEDGQTRITGNGGLIVDEEGKRWKCFAQDIGGGVLDAIAWCEFDEPDHNALTTEQRKTMYAILSEKTGVSLEKPRKHIVTMQAAYVQRDQFLSQSVVTNSGKFVPGSIVWTRGDSLYKEPDEPIQWLVDGVLEMQSFDSIYGPAGHGKSFVTLELALKVLSGNPQTWLGKPISMKGDVVYIRYEGGRKRFKQRFKHLVESIKLTEEELTHFHAIEQPPTLEILLKNLNEVCALWKPVLIVVDSLYMSHDQEENSNTDMKALGRLLQSLMITYGSCVLVIHHTSKHVEDKPMHQDNFQCRIW
jgi:hypothetical protein